MRRLLIAGNWKMNTLRETATALAGALAEAYPQEPDSVEILVCPPFPYLLPVRDAIDGSAVQLGAQNAYHEAPGAYTGEVALDMLLDVGCRWVIVGHSERRHVLGESDELLNKKVQAALAKGLNVIYCVGEKLEQREADQTEQVLDHQMETGLAGCSGDALAKLVVAYEPVWAIGTGVRATKEQAESAHKHLREWLASRYNAELAEQTRILYGGSVKAGDDQQKQETYELLCQPNVDGALVGGASLKAEEFKAIIEAGERAAQAGTNA